MFYFLLGLVSYQLIVQLVSADFLTNCQSGLDQTVYAHDLLSKIKLKTDLGLPRRYLGSIQLESGGIFNLSSLHLIDQPVKVVCANSSLGALQIKFSITNVMLAYVWSFNGEKCQGLARTEPQDIFVDLNLEKDEFTKKVRLMSSYITALTQTDFKVRFKNCIYPNQMPIQKQVKSVCKKVSLNDVEMILQKEIKSFANDFIDRNELFIY